MSRLLQPVDQLIDNIDKFQHLVEAAPLELPFVQEHGFDHRPAFVAGTGNHSFQKDFRDEAPWAVDDPIEDRKILIHPGSILPESTLANLPFVTCESEILK